MLCFAMQLLDGQCVAAGFVRKERATVSTAGFVRKEASEGSGV